MYTNKTQINNKDYLVPLQNRVLKIHQVQSFDYFQNIILKPF